MTRRGRSRHASLTLTLTLTLTPNPNPLVRGWVWFFQPLIRTIPYHPLGLFVGLFVGFIPFVGMA